MFQRATEKLKRSSNTLDENSSRLTFEANTVIEKHANVRPISDPTLYALMSRQLRAQKLPFNETVEGTLLHQEDDTYALKQGTHVFPLGKNKDLRTACAQRLRKDFSENLAQQQYMGLNNDQIDEIMQMMTRGISVTFKAGKKNTFIPDADRDDHIVFIVNATHPKVDSASPSNNSLQNTDNYQHGNFQPLLELAKDWEAQKKHLSGPTSRLNFEANTDIKKYAFVRPDNDRALYALMKRELRAQNLAFDDKADGTLLHQENDAYALVQGSSIFQLSKNQGLRKACAQRLRKDFSANLAQEQQYMGLNNDQIDEIMQIMTRGISVTFKAGNKNDFLPEMERDDHVVFVLNENQQKYDSASKSHYSSRYSDDSNHGNFQNLLESAKSWEKHRQLLSGSTSMITFEANIDIEKVAVRPEDDPSLYALMSSELRTQNLPFDEKAGGVLLHQGDGMYAFEQGKLVFPLGKNQNLHKACAQRLPEDYSVNLAQQQYGDLSSDQLEEVMQMTTRGISVTFKAGNGSEIITGNEKDKHIIFVLDAKQQDSDNSFQANFQSFLQDAKYWEEQGFSLKNPTPIIHKGFLDEAKRKFNLSEHVYDICTEEGDSTQWQNIPDNTQLLIKKKSERQGDAGGEYFVDARKQSKTFQEELRTAVDQFNDKGANFALTPSIRGGYIVLSENILERQKEANRTVQVQSWRRNPLFPKVQQALSPTSDTTGDRSTVIPPLDEDSWSSQEWNNQKQKWQNESLDPIHGPLPSTQLTIENITLLNAEDSGEKRPPSPAKKSSSDSNMQTLSQHVGR